MVNELKKDNIDEQNLGSPPQLQFYQ